LNATKKLDLTQCAPLPYLLGNGGKIALGVTPPQFTISPPTPQRANPNHLLIPLKFLEDHFWMTSEPGSGTKSDDKMDPILMPDLNHFVW